MSQSKTKAVTLLLAVLLAGGVMGWVAHQLAIPSQRPPAAGVDALVTRYTRELNLDAAQQDSVRSILVRRQRETRAIWQEVHPRYEIVRGRAKSEIEAQLRPDQKQQFDALIAQEDQERAARLKERGMTDSTQGQQQP
jgi:hypothetical protein